MTIKAASKTTTRVSAGARFYKCALQVNPHHYGNTYRGQPTPGNDASHVNSLIDRCEELGIEVLAITDHNSIDAVPEFRSAARGRGLHVIPGFELSSSEGIHVLCLYPPETSLDLLGRYLGEFGIRDINPSSTPADATFAKILETVVDQGGITIAAHVTGKGGLFRVLTGQPGIKAWRDENLFAVQIPGAVEDLPQNVRQIVTNKNSDYRRSTSSGQNLPIATINAKDIVNASNLDQHSATCWIKMDRVNISGLRQAFLDPGSRIRLNSRARYFEPEKHMEMVSIGWEGGFLDGVKIQLNPNLNVLIGGRGSGKSTVVESIRYALGLSPIGDYALKAHEGIVRHVLRGGTKVSLRVRVQRPGAREYLIERTIPNPPLVRDTNGKLLSLAPEDILPGIEAFGQHEITELTRSPDRLIRLLDRFVKFDETISRRKSSLQSDLRQNRRALCNIRAEINSINEQVAALPGLQETLKRFQEVGLEQRLAEQSSLVREERVLGSITPRLKPFQDALSILQGELPVDLSFLSERALSELPNKEILSRANLILARLGKESARAADSLKRALELASQEVALLKTDWETKKTEAQSRYEKILRGLQESRVDGEEFLRLRRRIEDLRPLKERLLVLEQQEKAHVTRRNELLAEWEDLKAKELRTFDKAAREISAKLRNRVQVELTGSGNRQPLCQLLRQEIGGRILEAIESLRTMHQISLTSLVEDCRSGASRLQKAYGFTPIQAKKIAEGDPEVFMKIEELELPPLTAIRLNTASAGDAPVWRSLEDLSTGQKATAVLLLLLLESEAPLIVDQPEDDLDNRFISEGIVPRMREAKQCRQFIFSTHNANIPVLGDAELILGLSAAGEAGSGRSRIIPEHAGSIDSDTVRELIEEVLEGGRDAFETRRRKYGF